jgi:putative membrane protein
MENLTRSLTDKLAIDRTRLANERTFLAYFRSFIVFLSSGFAILKLDVLTDIKGVGIMLMSLGPILFFIGLFRFLYVKRSIKKYDS